MLSDYEKLQQRNIIAKKTLTVTTTPTTTTTPTINHDNHHCPICSLSFNRKCDMIRHLNKHYGKGNVETTPTIPEFFHKNKCSICNLSLRRKIDMIRHINMHLADGTAPIIPTTFIVPADHNSHICPICNNTFSRRCDLSKHYQTHLDNPIAPTTSTVPTTPTTPTTFIVPPVHNSPICPVCNKAFTRRCSLAKHFNNNHLDNPANPSTSDPRNDNFCNICKITFKRNCDLNGNFEMHLPNRYYCTECSVHFSISTQKNISLKNVLIKKHFFTF